MAGYEVVKVGTNADGGVDLEDLRAKADEDVACLMLTNPNTLGLFDAQHRARSPRSSTAAARSLYYDGANLNAIVGRSRPGDMGFDIVHFNLHKTFTQPHGGGGPGAGPIAVSDRIAPYLMTPRVARATTDGVVRPRLRPAEVDRPAARLPRQLRHLRPRLRLHPLARRRGPARRLRDRGPQRQLPAGAAARGASTSAAARLGELCMHEFVLSGAPMKRELGIRTLDLAKRLLDFGVHPPTVYFPLLVDEALMIEPTETETQGDARRFAETIAGSCARPPRTPRSPATPRTRRRCAASTRRPPRANRSSAKPSTRWPRRPRRTGSDCVRAGARAPALGRDRPPTRRC